MLGITFGSFGDIVAAAELAIKVYNALRDSQGAVYEYQLLIDELDSLAKVLKMSNNCARQAVVVDPSIADGLLQEARRCLALLDRFHARIEGYQRALGRGGNGRSWRKVGWMLFKQNDIANLRAKLMGHRENLVLYMQTVIVQISHQNAIDIRHTLKRNTARIEQDLIRVNTTADQILNVLKSFPSRMYTGQGNGIRLIDFLGQSVVIPMSVCATWEGMKGYIRMITTDRVGQSLISDGDYELIREGEEEVLQPADWAKSVEPGMVVEMAAIIRRAVLRRPLQGLKLKCYRCGKEKTNKQDWLQCLRCDAHSRVTWTNARYSFQFHGERQVQLVRRVHFEYIPRRRRRRSLLSRSLQHWLDLSEEEEWAILRFASVGVQQSTEDMSGGEA